MTVESPEALTAEGEKGRGVRKWAPGMPETRP